MTCEARREHDRSSVTRHRSDHCDDLSSQDADVFITVDRSLRYELIEKLCERYAAARRRCAYLRIGEPSNSEGERSNFEGDRGKN